MTTATATDLTRGTIVRDVVCGETWEVLAVTLSAFDAMLAGRTLDVVLRHVEDGSTATLSADRVEVVSPSGAASKAEVLDSIGGLQYEVAQIVDHVLVMSTAPEVLDAVQETLRRAAADLDAIRATVV